MCVSGSTGTPICDANDRLNSVESEHNRRYLLPSAAASAARHSAIIDSPMPRTSHTTTYLRETAEIAALVDVTTIDLLVAALLELRERGGRVFFLGVGGSAANCSHAVNDFRKLCSIEAYAPTDNVAELTARINDQGWDDAISSWLAASNLTSNDAVFVLSVGGGDEQRSISVNLIRAIEHAQHVGATTLAIVGKPDGFAATHADVAVVIPTIAAERVTPHAEVFQAVIWHCIVSNPLLQSHATTW